MGRDEQAVRILHILAKAEVVMTCGPCDVAGWFARLHAGPTFFGADLVDALAQLTTFLAITEPT